MNHFLHHKDWDEDKEYSLLIKGSKAVRAAEDDAGLSDSGLDHTPLCINLNYDFYSWFKPITGGYPKLKQYILDLLEGGAELDMIGLDYYPKTWSWHNVEDLMTILKKLGRDFGMQTSHKKRIILAETGYSTWFIWTCKGQKKYYKRLTELMADYYNNGGKTRGFRGVVWYNFMSSDKYDYVPHEKHFGVIRRKDDGTVELTKLAWKWMKENQGLPPW